MHDVRSKSPPWGYASQSNSRVLPDPPAPLLGLDIDRCITKVESGKCRRVTAATDVIVTLCHKSVGKRVCDVLQAVSIVTRRQAFVSRW